MHVLQLVIAGIQQGAIIALLAMGVTLMFGVLRVVNFAQADFMMVGMYGAVLLYGLVQVNVAILALALLVPALLAGWLLYQAVIRPVAKTRLGTAPEHAQMLATLGLSLIIQNLAETIWGSTPRTLESSQELSAWHLGSLTIDKPRTYAFIMAIVVAVVMLKVLRSTYVGRAARAAASDPEAAQYVGINVQRTYAWTFAGAVALAVVAGGFLASYYPVNPFTGNDFILLMFTAIILGGLGNVFGALAGGLTLGLAQSLSQLVIPLQLNMAVVFGVFLLVMLFRPSGVFPEASRL